RNFPPERSARRRLSHDAPSQRTTPSAILTSRMGVPFPSARSSALVGDSGLPGTALKVFPSVVRKTPAVVTRTGEPNPDAKRAIGVPAGALSGGHQRPPPSKETFRPLKLERRRTVEPSGPRKTARDAAGGRGSSERRRTRMPCASQTPLSWPAYARKKKTRLGSFGSVTRSETRPSASPTEPGTSVTPASSE